jgi:two-component system response regulator
MEQFEEIEVLFVEDNALDAELTIRALKKGGLANKLLRLEDGQQALDYLFRRGPYTERPDGLPRLLLLDLKMPRVDGIEVLRAVRADERTQHIPVVIMTSSQEEKDIAQSYALGVNSYVVKPVEFSAFTDVVRQAGFYWLAINRPPEPQLADGSAER